jgi:hypothetical protein
MAILFIFKFFACPQTGGLKNKREMLKKGD